MPPEVIDVVNSEDRRDVVHRAVEVLAAGQLVVFPTETVYGLAASALDARAVTKLVEVKGRRRDHPLTLAIRSADEARDYVPDMSRLAHRLARRCWPGPVTLVVDDSHPESLVRRLPLEVRRVVSPGSTVGLRVPGHQVILDVLQMLSGPLALSSANPTGQPEATTAAEVLDALGDKVAVVLDDGPCRFGQPSTVVKVEGDRYEVLRVGVVPEQTLRRLSSTIVLLVCTGNTCRSPMAEAIFRDMLAKRLDCPPGQLQDRGVIVASAGIAAMMGGQASIKAIETMSQMGLDLADHQTQPLTETAVRHADVIYVMTRSHREAIVAQWPSAAERTFLLSPESEDISDPIGGGVDCYQQCASQIRIALAARLDELELPEDNGNRRECP